MSNRPLNVASHLSASLRVPLRIALGEGHRIAEATNWDDLADTLRRRPIDLVVADPAAEGPVDVKAVTDVMDRFPSTPVLVYTALTPSTVAAMAQLSRHGLRDVVLHRVDDTPERFQQVIERVARRLPPDRVLLGLAESMEKLPIAIARTLKQLFERPKAFQSGNDIAAHAGVSLSGLYRSLREVGIRSPKRLLIAARVLRAHTYMREPGHSIGEVATKLGYSHPRILAKHTDLVLGVKPRQLRRRMSDEAIVERLVEWIYDHTPIE
jgi:AraC-like DNA-binding protein